MANTKPVRLGDLEAVKRAFCNGEFSEFETLVKSADPPFVMFMGKGGTEKIPMDFIVKNRVAGFAQSLDSGTKWVFTCFKATPITTDSGTEYMFTSCWIVNTATPLADLGIDAESWILTETSSEDVIKYFAKDASEGFRSLAH